MAKRLHFCLEKLETIIKADKLRTINCDRTPDNEALVLRDKLLGGEKEYVAEAVPVYSVRLAARITPALVDTDDKTYKEVVDFILGLVDKEALSVTYEPERKAIGVSAKFPCGPSLTDMASAFENSLDEIRSFLDRHSDAIIEFLRCHGLFFD